MSKGRPTKAKIQEEERQGKDSMTTSLKCLRCHRHFPRAKSLQAHIRTHSGESPYECTYPDCSSTFKQSGQLKSHIFRHTGEKPFACPAEGCETRFAHSNRQCPQHMDKKLARDGKEEIRTDVENMNEDQSEWLRRYKEDKAKKNVKKSSSENSKKRKLKIEDIQDEKSCHSLRVNSEPGKKLFSSAEYNDHKKLPNFSSSPSTSESESSSGYNSHKSSDLTKDTEEGNIGNSITPDYSIFSQTLRDQQVTYIDDTDGLSKEDKAKKNVKKSSTENSIKQKLKIEDIQDEKSCYSLQVNSEPEKNLPNLSSQSTSESESSSENDSHQSLDLNKHTEEGNIGNSDVQIKTLDDLNIFISSSKNSNVCNSYTKKELDAALALIRMKIFNS